MIVSVGIERKFDLDYEGTVVDTKLAKDLSQGLVK